MRHMDQRRCAAPVFVRRVRVEDLRRVLRLDARQQPVLFAGLRVGLRSVREWEDVGRVELVEKRMAVARRLREAQVEAPAAAAGNMRHHAIEHLAMLLVFVEPVVKVGPQEAPALRHTERDCALNRARGNRQRVTVKRRRKFQVRDRVADRRGAHAGDRRILRAVDDLVNLPRLEAAGQIHAAAVQFPFALRDEAARAFDRVAYGQRVGRIVRVRNRIGDVIAIGER